MGPTIQKGPASSTHLDGGTKPAAVPHSPEGKMGHGWHSAPAFKQVPSVGELERHIQAPPHTEPCP